MTLEEFVQSAEADPDPPEELADEMRSLWLAKNGRWDEAHNIAQDIDTPMGSWIHAHLHLIEGDLSNSAYWYRRAGKPVGSPERIEEEWLEISAAAAAAAGA